MAAPSEIYVDPAIAADSGAGTIGDPYGDLQYALNTATRDATNGNRINIKAGTAELLGAQISYATYGNPTITAPLIFQGYTSAAGDGGIGDINGNTLNANMFPDKDYTSFKDLLIRGAGSGQCVRLSSGIIENCELRDCANYALVLSSAAKALNNYIHNCSNGIYIGTTCFALYNYLANGATKFTQAINLASTGAIAERNVISIDGGSIGILFSSGICRAWHNSILSASGTGTGIRTISGMSFQAIFNNLVEGFSGAGGDGIEATEANVDIQLYANNAVYNCTTAYTLADQAIVSGDNETLSASPFAKSGADTFANRATYFAPVATGNVRGGAYPTALRLDKGAVQHADPAVADYPAVGDVRNNIVYNNGGSEGVLALPTAGQVQTGVGFGANGTEFTGSFAGGGNRRPSIFGGQG